jgi:Domain of unknown function (DUF4352)
MQDQWADSEQPQDTYGRPAAAQAYQQPRFEPGPQQSHDPRRHDPGPGFTPAYHGQPGQQGYYPPQQQWQQPYAPAQPPQRRRHTARNVIVGLGSLIAVVIVISVAANSGHKLQTTGSTAGSGAPGGTHKTAGIGSAITLSGNSSGEQMAVTVTKVISDASPSDSFEAAPAGDRLYAVQFRLADTGSAPYSDAPSNGATVVDSAGQSYQSGLETVAGCQGFEGTENIAPKSSGLGCIVFEVPEKAKITQVQFTLDSGMGPDTGQWNVG